MLGAAAVGGIVALTASAHGLELAVIGAIATALLALSVAFALPSFIPWPLVLLAGEYAWSLGGGEIDQWSPLVAGALVVVAELAYWSLELRSRTQDAERLTERRAGLIAAIGIGAVALGGFVLARRPSRSGRASPRISSASPRPSQRWPSSRRSPARGASVEQIPRTGFEPVLPP